MKRLIIWLALTAASLMQAASPLELKLWPDGAPGRMEPPSPATAEFVRTKAGKTTLTNIHDPSIVVYRPEKPNGTSVIVAPGGAYVFLSAVHEGSQVCEWLNELGVTAILLKYRTPTRDEAAPYEKPVQDAARAIALVREHAKEWSLNPDRVGLLGFSAGGNLLAHIACDRPAAVQVPNFGIMIYGGGFVDPKQPTHFKDGFMVPPDAPPMFIVCAHDDGQNPFGLATLYLEYKKHHIPAEIHLFTHGGHGFGMRKNGHPISEWPQRCAEWMQSMGWLATP
jgi:predicted esterase